MLRWLQVCLLATHALGGGKPRDKKQWNAALNQWQEGQNQEFMQEYEDEQAEREAVRQKRLPKFDPENPKAYMNAMSDDSGDGMVGAMGGGGSNPDGAQITIVKLKNGLMKTRADTELLVSRWRDILTTIGIKAFPYVMSRDQVMINVQEGFRVPDIKMFALDQEESKYFEQGGKKYYPKGTAADPDDEEPAPFEEEEPPPVKPKPKPKEPDWPASPGQKKASDAKPPAATEPAVVVNGGWKSDWSSCVGCKRACGPIPAAVCNVERFEAGEMTEEKFREIRNRKPFIIVNGSLNMEPTHRSKWSRAALLQDYKKHIVELGNPISLYDGHAANGHSKTFANYLEIFDHFEEADSENLYLVDSKLGSGKPTDAWHLPDFKPLGVFPFGREPDQMIFSLGWSASGLPFHTTGEIWNELVWGGTSKWYMYPPSQVPARGYNAHNPQKDWVRKAYYKNGTWNPADKKKRGKAASEFRRPIECTQQAGDVLYIPTGWYHANVNCGQTVAVSAQVDVTADDAADMTGPEGYMKPFAAALNAFKRGQEQESIALLELANELTDNSNDVVLYNLGRVLGHVHGSQGDTGLAVAKLQRCVDLNPYNARCWFYICVGRLQSGNMEEAAEIFDRAWSLLPHSLRDDDSSDEMKLVQKLRKAFSGAAERRNEL